MGYELHITRREEWSNMDGEDISMDEWLQYVKTDEELLLTNGYETKFGTEVRKVEIPGFCQWKAHPAASQLNYTPWFSHHTGSIDTKKPDIPTIRKMLQIASALNAKVQGDDGELYTLETVHEMERFESEIAMKKKAAIKNAKPWWKFW